VAKNSPELCLGTKHLDRDDAAQILPCFRIENTVDLVRMKTLVLNAIMVNIIVQGKVVVYIEQGL
jgi:hypothetical protein